MTEQREQIDAQDQGGERLNQARNEGLEIEGLDQIRSTVEQLSLLGYYDSLGNELYEDPPYKEEEIASGDVHEREFIENSKPGGWKFEGRLPEYNFFKGERGTPDYQEVSIYRTRFKTQLMFS